MNRTERLSLLALVLMLCFGSITVEGKRLDVMVMTNGYPTGVHFDLNIHGEDSADPGTEADSVFISEYGLSTIEYIWNGKTAPQSELKVLDPFAELFDGNSAKVQLPYDPEGYYVFARLRGKPARVPNSENPGSIILKPKPVLKECDDTEPADPEFPPSTGCEHLMALGIVTAQGICRIADTGLFRFEKEDDTTGEGKAAGKDLSGLFRWTGYVCRGTMDSSGPEGTADGIIDAFDVPKEYDKFGMGGNGNDIIDPSELDIWLQHQLAEGNCDYYDNRWIWEIADLVVEEQDLVNDEAKLLKLRWYPASTTDFIS